LDAIKSLKQWQTRHEEESANHEEVKRALTKIDQEITQLKSREHIARGKRERLGGERETLVAEAAAAQREEDRVKSRVHKIEANLAEQQSAVRNLKTEIEAFEAELKTKMTQTLSDDEIQQMSDLTEEIDQLKKELVGLSQSVLEVCTRSLPFTNPRSHVFFAQLARKKDNAEVDLNENLRRLREDLRGQIEAHEAGTTQEGPAVDVAARKREMQKLDSDIADLGNKLERSSSAPPFSLGQSDRRVPVELETEAEALNTQIASLAKDKEKKEGDQANDSRTLSKQQKSVERYLAKRQLLLTRKDECNKSIRDLGVLPEEAFVETNTSSEKARSSFLAILLRRELIRPFTCSFSKSCARSTKR
jgi:structural maintenance of chromosome 3 (chondroitin sulfate proteoglycan 6)